MGLLQLGGPAPHHVFQHPAVFVDAQGHEPGLEQ